MILMNKGWTLCASCTTDHIVNSSHLSLKETCCVLKPNVVSLLCRRSIFFPVTGVWRALSCTTTMPACPTLSSTASTASSSGFCGTSWAPGLTVQTETPWPCGHSDWWMTAPAALSTSNNLPVFLVWQPNIHEHLHQAPGVYHRPYTIQKAKETQHRVK